jgi:hypothetical protein
MDWNNTQNFSSNIVFGILLFAMILYWIIFFLFKETKNIIQLGKFSAIVANMLLFFYPLFKMDCGWLFSIK